MLVVAQPYDAHVFLETAIRGNSIVMKCQIPSFVADFVQVLSWHSDHNEDFYQDNSYGQLFLGNGKLSSSFT